ncbi:MAG: GNAT family N-acetyltransferase, partial [Alphaproteobacteria bacterium]
MSDTANRFVNRARKASAAEGLSQLVNLPGYRYGTMRVPFHSVDQVVGWIQSAPSSNLELVAAVDDQIIGLAGLRRLSGRQHHMAYLGMGVHDDWLRRGVGTALM